MQEKRDNIEQWLLNIGQYIKQEMEKPLAVAEKTSLSDVVTNVDKAVEEMFRQKISQDYPTHRILGEEGVDKDNISHLAGDVWIIDPIDGTLNFVKEQQNFGVMVAYYKDGVGELGFIYEVMAGDLYIAQRGKGVTKNGKFLPRVTDLPLAKSMLNVSANIFYMNPVPFEDKLKNSLSVRIVGSAAMSFIRLINGHHQGYVCVFLNPWDYMAGLIFTKELGIVTTDFEGNPIKLLSKTTLLAASLTAHRDILGK